MVLSAFDGRAFILLVVAVIIVVLLIRSIRIKNESGMRLLQHLADTGSAIYQCPTPPDEWDLRPGDLWVNKGRWYVWDGGWKRV